MQKNTLEYWKNKHTDAKEFAAHWHQLETYNGQPYTVHLADTEQVLLEHGFSDETIENYQYRIECWLHDVLEGAPLSKNNIVKIFGEDIAETCFLLKEYRGRNRAERKPDIYYIDIGKDEHASIVKIADRISNIRNGQKKEMFDLYVKEQTKFSLIRKTNEEIFQTIPAKLDNLWQVLLQTFETRRKYFYAKENEQ